MRRFAEATNKSLQVFTSPFQSTILLCSMTPMWNPPATDNHGHIQAQMLNTRWIAELRSCWPIARVANIWSNPLDSYCSNLTIKWQSNRGLVQPIHLLVGGKQKQLFLWSGNVPTIPSSYWDFRFPGPIPFAKDIHVDKQYLRIIWQLLCHWQPWLDILQPIGSNRPV